MTSERFLGDRTLWHLFLLRGVAGSIAFSLAYVSLTYLTVGDSVSIFFLNPIFSSLLAWPVLGERVGWVEAVAISFGLLGTLLVVKPPVLFGGGVAPPNPFGVFITVLSAAFCSVAMISIRYIGKRASPLVLALWFHGCSTIMGALSCLSGWPNTPVWPSTSDWCLLMLIAFTSFFGQVSLNYAYQTLPTLRASALYYLMVVWSAVLGAVFLGESMDAFGGLGAVVIALGGLMPSANKARLKMRARGEEQTELEPEAGGEDVGEGGTRRCEGERGVDVATNLKG